MRVTGRPKGIRGFSVTIFVIWSKGCRSRGRRVAIARRLTSGERRGFNSVGQQVDANLFKLWIINDGARIQDKRANHELSTQVSIMLAPCPSSLAEVLITNHLFVMSLPAFIDRSLCRNPNQVHPMAMSLHVIKVREGALHEEMSVVQSISTRSGAKGNFLKLEILIESDA